MTNGLWAIFEATCRGFFLGGGRRCYNNNSRRVCPITWMSVKCRIQTWRSKVAKEETFKRLSLKPCGGRNPTFFLQCQKMRQMADDNYFIPYFYVLLWRGMPWTWLLIAPYFQPVYFQHWKNNFFPGIFFSKRDDARKISSFFSALLSLSFQLLKGERLV